MTWSQAGLRLYSWVLFLSSNTLILYFFSYWSPIPSSLPSSKWLFFHNDSHPTSFTAACATICLEVIFVAVVVVVDNTLYPTNTFSLQMVVRPSPESWVSLWQPLLTRKSLSLPSQSPSDNNSSNEDGNQDPSVVPASIFTGLALWRSWIDNHSAVSRCTLIYVMSRSWDFTSLLQIYQLLHLLPILCDVPWDLDKKLLILKIYPQLNTHGDLVNLNQMDSFPSMG